MMSETTEQSPSFEWGRWTPLWTIYCETDERFIGQQRVRSASREQAVKDSRFADKAKDICYSVWASWKCDCGC